MIQPITPAGRGFPVGPPCTASASLAGQVSAGTVPGLAPKLADLPEAPGVPAGGALRQAG